MTIIIDGYNVLKQREPREYITEAQRKQLIKLALRYGLKRGHEIVIVFDGGPEPKPSRENYHGVAVVYAGWQLTADDVIKEYIQDNAQKELLLVSSDTQLCAFGVQYKVTSIDALAFWEIMEETLQKNSEDEAAVDSHVVKTTQRENQVVDDLMKEASLVMQDKDRGKQRAKTRLREQHKGSKAERLLRKKLAKL